MTASATANDRAEISRRNGGKSHGPTSPEGKARSRMNAVKHGLSARIPVLPGEDEAAFRQRVDDFLEALAPRNAAEVALAEQAALASWKILRAERAEAARVAAALRAAEAAAGTEDQDEVSALGYWLLAENLRVRQEAGKCLLPFLTEDRHEVFRCGDGDPRHIVLRLEATALGCRWLQEQWDRLGARLERGEDWQIPDLIVALQLRGQLPMGMDAIDWDDLLEPVAAGGKPGVNAKATRLMLLQWDELLPDDPGARRSALLRRVQDETERLQQREAAHQAREAADRAELADRLAVDTTAEGERMRRYHLDCDRKLHRAIESLLKLRRGQGIGGASDPVPAGDPAPDPAGPMEPEGGRGDGPHGEGETESPTRPDLSLPEPTLNGITAPAPSVAGPESRTVPQNEPGTPAEGERIAQNEPGPPAAERSPQNQPGAPVHGDSASQDGPGRSGRIADMVVPALVCALVFLLAVRLELVRRVGTSLEQGVAAGESLGQARDLLASGGIVVDVPVATAVSDSFHQARDRVTNRWWVSRT
jgi:hypothetical protein